MLCKIKISGKICMKPLQIVRVFASFSPVATTPTDPISVGMQYYCHSSGQTSLCRWLCLLPSVAAKRKRSLACFVINIAPRVYLYCMYDTTHTCIVCSCDCRLLPVCGFDVRQFWNSLLCRRKVVAKVAQKHYSSWRQSVAQDNCQSVYWNLKNALRATHRVDHRGCTYCQRQENRDACPGLSSLFCGTSLSHSKWYGTEHSWAVYLSREYTHRQLQPLGWNTNPHQTSISSIWPSFPPCILQSQSHHSY